MNRSADRPDPTPSGASALLLGVAAAGTLLVGGLVHLQLYFDGYRDVPNQNLGRSFLANAVASALVAAALLLRRDVILRAAAIAISVGTLVAFALSRTDGGIFGFTEQGLEPSPQAALTLVTEIATIGLVGLTFVPRLATARQLARRVALPLAAAAVVGTVVGAIVWSETPSGSTAAASDVAGGETSVAISGFAFGTSPLTVPVGATVTWTNADGFAHTVTDKAGTFDSGDLATGATFAHTFDVAGSFPYICAIHPSMAGTVVVGP